MLRRLLALALVLSLAGSAAAQGAPDAATAGLVPRFTLPESGLFLERTTSAGAFFDVLGRRAAVFGYENRPFEVWAYPQKILDDFRLHFAIEDYPVAIDGLAAQRTIEVRPEATTLVYTHAAFTVRQTIFAPIDEPGVVMLLDVDAARPLTITASFTPDLRLMWPAGLMTGFLGWDAPNHRYFIGEETQRFFGIVGSPLAEDVSVQPYQEEPQDLPTRFTMRVTPETARRFLIPVVVAGSVNGRAEAEATYERLLANAAAGYRTTTEHYRALEANTLRVDTPDDRLDMAFAWAKVGVDKGLATNPMLGTGFLAGFRTSGESERPGFAWFFGRDALWTALGSTAYGDFAATAAALRFLAGFQRADGKIPHELSQSAGLLDWFEDYPYGWASADATPLFVIALADYWRTSGDAALLRELWPAALRAYRFSEQTDRDGNGLIENTGVGHGWVEGGALYPPHEELYMQGLFIQAARDVAEMAHQMADERTAAEAAAAAERTREAAERTYWLPDSSHYAFATRLPGAAGLSESALDASTTLSRAERRGGRAELVRENTVLQAVPLWFRTLDAERAQGAIDAFGGGAVATDWGARILSDESALYDPLSYHYGSVWPLFTGWASMGAYRYGRPHVGYQALVANALLTYQDALGYVTELISGDYNTAFGRSSHHQVWSEAMVATPLVRGLLGIDVTDGGRTLRLAPQLPADWDRVRVEAIPAGAARYNLDVERGPGRMTLRLTAGEGGGTGRLELAPALPLDARVQSVTLGGRAVPFETAREGDVQRVEVEAPLAGTVEAVFEYDGGTEVIAETTAPAPGAVNRGLRLLRVRPEADATGGVLRLVVEGPAGSAHQLRVRSPFAVEATEGVRVTEGRVMEGGTGEAVVEVAFDGAPGTYVRRTLALALRPRS